jgi:branched-chain amino acid transport system substrate-binding protein
MTRLQSELERLYLPSAEDGVRAAVRNFQRLVDEQKVDVVMGSSVTPATMPLVLQAAERKVPLLSLAASSRIVLPQDDVRRWTFKAIQNESLMVGCTLDHMAAAKVRTIGFIGFADAYGESWLQELQQQVERRGQRIVAVERYARTDASVMSQALRVAAAKPDAVFIAAAGTPGALPQKTLVERGYTGPVYQTYGIANKEFLRISGKDAEGAVFAVGPVLVAEQLDAANPIRAVALDVTQRYEAAYGAGSMNVFVANAWDSMLLLRAGVERALQRTKPGSEAFRAALRDGLEQTRQLVTSQGVMNLGAADHVGYDERAAVMVQIRGGRWQLLK